jgi:hypothetical protein
LRTTDRRFGALWRSGATGNADFKTRLKSFGLAIPAIFPG